jgi:hypothetical protein
VEPLVWCRWNFAD